MLQACEQLSSLSLTSAAVGLLSFFPNLAARCTRLRSLALHGLATTGQLLDSGACVWALSAGLPQLDTLEVTSPSTGIQEALLEGPRYDPAAQPLMSRVTSLDARFGTEDPHDAGYLEDGAEEEGEWAFSQHLVARMITQPQLFSRLRSLRLGRSYDELRPMHLAGLTALESLTVHSFDLETEDNEEEGEEEDGEGQAAPPGDAAEAGAAALGAAEGGAAQAGAGGTVGAAGSAAAGSGIHPALELLPSLRRLELTCPYVWYELSNTSLRKLIAQVGLPKLWGPLETPFASTCVCMSGRHVRTPTVTIASPTDCPLHSSCSILHKGIF